MFLLLSALTLAAESPTPDPQVDLQSERPSLPMLHPLPLQAGHPALAHQRRARLWRASTGVLVGGTIVAATIGGVFSYPWLILGCAALGANAGAAWHTRRFTQVLGYRAGLGTLAVIGAGLSVPLIAAAVIFPGPSASEAVLGFGVGAAVVSLPLTLLQASVTSHALWNDLGTRYLWPWQSVELLVVPQKEGAQVLMAGRF